jgi:uncharacterized protein YukE
VAVDPDSLQNNAASHDAAAAALGFMEFPVIAAWNGVAGQMFQARLDALRKRREELGDAHDRVAVALRAFAVVAESLQGEMRFRAAERSAAIEQASRIEAAMVFAVDPGERNRLQLDREASQHLRRIADRAHAQAQQAFNEAEECCGRAIDSVAHLSQMEPLADRLEQLPLADFMAYKSLVASGVVAAEGLNWTTDGCSDHGIVTGSIDLAECERHDFAYRNNDATTEPRWLDKQKADVRLATDMARKALPNRGNLLKIAIMPASVPLDLQRAGLTFLGVELFGRPSSAQADDKKRAKKSARRRASDSRDK